MTTTIKDLSINERRKYLERVVGSALNEGATVEAIDAWLLGEGGVQNPEAIRASACRRRSLPRLGSGELLQLGGRDGLRDKVGLPPATRPMSEFARKRSGEIDEGDPENIRRALSTLGYEFGYDALACAEHVTYRDAPRLVDDAVLNRAWLQIDTTFGFLPTLQVFQIVVSDLARANSHHPVIDYLDSLTWDQTPRLDTWLVRYAGATDTPFNRAAGALTLIAAVRRARYAIVREGVKFDELLVLYGPQGPGKSKLIAALSPHPAWFTDSLSLGDDPKRVIENTRGIWIAEIGELQGTQREVERIKVFLSRSVDGPVRMAYARTPVRAPRQFITFGTTNDPQFLKDLTGNRRFWPVVVANMRPDLLMQERDQLWAEASLREATQGESLHLPTHLWSDAAALQEEFREKHPFEELLEDNLDLSKPAITVEATWAALSLQTSQRDNRPARLIAHTMKRAGYVKKQIRVKGTSKTKRCWVKDPNQSTLDAKDILDAPVPPF